MPGPRTPLLLALVALACSPDDRGDGGTTADATLPADTTATTVTPDLTSTADPATTTAPPNDTTTAATDPTSPGTTAVDPPDPDTTTTATTTTATTTTEPDELDCQELALGGPYTVTAETPAFPFELPMTPGVAYRRLEVRFTFDPADWGGQCYNPYYDPPKLVPVFHQLLTLRRGPHWCKGGNLGEFSFQGPDKNRLIAEVWYQDPPWDGPGCGPEITPFAPFGGEHDLAPISGQANPVELIYDADADALQLTIGDLALDGVPHPDAELLAPEGWPLVLTFSFENANECYDAAGNQSDAAVCCHAPSLGWTFDAIAVTLCQ